jgi:CspA family cold shock protein
MTYTSPVPPPTPDNEFHERVVVNEVPDEIKVGEYVGQCKWFNDVYGYGFLTIQTGDEKGKDIFVHHSGVKPLNSLYKTLKKGEYVNFNIVTGENGLQAVDVTGIGGGTLLCDVLPAVKRGVNRLIPITIPLPHLSPAPTHVQTVGYPAARMPAMDHHSVRGGGPSGPRGTGRGRGQTMRP